MLTALAPFRLRSPVFHVTGEYGETKETELVIGGAAGGVRVRLTVAEGELTGRIGVSVMWADPDAKSMANLGEVSVRGKLERAVPDEEGAYVIDAIPPGEATLRVRARGFTPQARQIAVVAGEYVELAVEMVREVLEDLLRSERISFVFSDTPLDDALGYISRSKGINIVLMPAAREGLRNERVSLTVEDDSVESALRALCDAAGDLTFRIQDGLVLIEKRER